MRKKLFAAKRHIKHKLNLSFRSAPSALFCGQSLPPSAFGFRFDFLTGKLRAIMNQLKTLATSEPSLR